MAELDEREGEMMRELCRSATKSSGYLETIVPFQLFDPFDPNNRLKMDVAQSLVDKGYAEIVTKDFAMKLTKPKGYNYCMNLRESAK
jgi:hypothetical protein